MVKLIALYKMPANPEAFDQQYFEHHLPLLKRLPELKGLETAKFAATTIGENRYYRIEQLTFESQDHLDRAMASPTGRNVAHNLTQFAGNDVAVYYAESDS